jgi:uncharacterized membrane protein YfcA
VWKTITFESVTLNLMMLPFILLGAVAGIFIVKIIPEKPFRWFIIVMTTLASFRLIALS